MPQCITDIHSRTVFEQQLDHGHVASGRSLMQRGRVRMKSVRIEAVRILSYREQESHHINLSADDCQRECAMT